MSNPNTYQVGYDFKPDDYFINIEFDFDNIEIQKRLEKISEISIKLIDLVKSIFIYLECIFKKWNIETSQLNDLDRAIRSLQGENGQYGAEDWIEGNHFLVTQSAKETNDWRLDLIRNAKQSIELSGSICGGAVFREALEVMRGRLKSCPELKVHLLTIPVFLEKEDLDLLQELQKNYGDRFNYIISTSKPCLDFHTIENHAKLMVVDEKYFVIGGTNYQDRLCKENTESPPSNMPLSDRLFGSGSCDMDVIGCGKSLAAVFRREYFKLYAFLEYNERLQQGELSHRYFPLQPDQQVAEIERFDAHADLARSVEAKAIMGSPYKDACTKEYAELAKETQSTLVIAQMYFHPHQEIQEGVQTAMNNQAKVTVFTSGLNIKDSPLSAHAYGYANRNYYLKLKKKNENEVFLHGKNNNIFHKKVVVVDEEKMAIGSYNWGGKCHRDFEMMIVIRSREVAKKTLDILEQDKQDCQTVEVQPTGINKKIDPLRLVGVVEHSLFRVLVG